MDDELVKSMTEAFKDDTETPEAPTEAPTTTPEQPETTPEDKKEQPASAPTGDASDKGADSPKEEEPKTPEAPEAPTEPEAPEAPTPLTEESIRSIISEVRTEAVTSTKELDNMTQEVLEAYYPDGLSNDLIDEKSGKVLKTPADVVEATDGAMTTEQAANWLMNEQFKLDKSVQEIRESAKTIAKTTVDFKRDAISAVKKYEPLFKEYPALQEKVWKKLMKQVKVDDDKGVILSSPDVMEHYDDYLEPYQQAYEFKTQQPATQAVPEDKPEPPKPTAEDRMDESGDVGATTPVDPNDFAAAVTKELSTPN